MLDVGKLARVELVPDAADVIATTLGSFATAPFKGPGLGQDDAVQLVSRWAWMRDRFNRGASNNVKVSLYDTKAGKFAGIYEGSASSLAKKLEGRPELAATLIVGNGPLASPVPGGGELGDDWGPQLARAIDAETIAIADMPRGADVPLGFGSITKTIAAPVVVGIIVGGAAIAVIGGIAAWRYFDPEHRSYVSGLNAAAKAYDARIQTFKATGKMPDPTPTEVSMAKQIQEQAKKEQNKSVLMALGIAGGITLGAVGISYARR